MRQPFARQTASMPACLPEQLCFSRDGGWPSGPHSRSSSPAWARASSIRTAVELLGPGEVRRRGDRELPRVGVVVGPRERQRLERLRRRAKQRDERRVARLDDRRAVANRDGVDEVRRLDDAAAPHDYPDGLGHGGRTLDARATRDGGLAAPARRAGARVSDREGRAGARRDAENVRPAAVGARRQAARRRAAAGEAAAVPDRGRRARPARPPDDRGPPPLPAAPARRARSRRPSGSRSRAARSSCSPRRARRSARACGC